jgi:glycerol-3-phosphate dehydrogenase (NAD(P)+)
MDSGSRVLILGYGEMGHAMEYLLGPRHELQIWNRHPVTGLVPLVLEEAAAGADFVIYTVPVTPLGQLAARVLPHLSGHSVSLTVAKGLDASARPAPRILADVYAGERDFGVLYGPMIAEEIRAGRPAYAQVGVSRQAVLSRITGLYAGSNLTLVPSADLYGIAWASLLKNIYAMLFGAADALGLGDNARGYLVVAAVTELEAIVAGRGGRRETAHDLAGLGDLVTTGTSAGSHHRALGGQLVRGETGLQGEGIHTLAMLRQFRLFDESVFPLFTLARRLVEQPAAGRVELRDFLLHPARR